MHFRHQRRGAEQTILLLVPLLAPYIGACMLWVGARLQPDRTAVDTGSLPDQSLFRLAGGIPALLASSGEKPQASCSSKSDCATCASQAHSGRSKVCCACPGSHPHGARCLTSERMSVSACGQLKAMQSSKQSPTCGLMRTMRCYFSPLQSPRKLWMRTYYETSAGSLMHALTTKPQSPVDTSSSGLQNTVRGSRFTQNFKKGFASQEYRSLLRRVEAPVGGLPEAVCLVAVPSDCGDVVGSLDLRPPACAAGSHPKGVPKVQHRPCSLSTSSWHVCCGQAAPWPRTGHVKAAHGCSSLDH